MFNDINNAHSSISRCFTSFYHPPHFVHETTLQNTPTAEDLFDPVAYLNDAGVVNSFKVALEKTRHHLSEGADAAAKLKYEDMTYHFQVGTQLLMALFDGLAVYVEKKLKTKSTPGNIYWAREKTFSSPEHVGLKQIKERTQERRIEGDITADALRNFAKHYLPWLDLPSGGRGGIDDIRFKRKVVSDGIETVVTSGPVFRGLLHPLFNDARDAVAVLAKLLKKEVVLVEKL